MSETTYFQNLTFWVFFKIEFLKFVWKLLYWVLSQIDFCNFITIWVHYFCCILRCVRIWVLSFVTFLVLNCEQILFWVIMLIEFLSFVTIWLLSLEFSSNLSFGVWSQSEYLIFLKILVYPLFLFLSKFDFWVVIIWVFRFGYKLSLFTIWVVEFCHNLSFLITKLLVEETNLWIKKKIYLFCENCQVGRQVGR